MFSAFEHLRYAYKDESIVSSVTADLEKVNSDSSAKGSADKLHNIDEDLSYHSCHPMDADKYEVRKFEVDTSVVSGGDSHGHSDDNKYNTGMPGIIDVSSILDDETDANKITLAGQHSSQFSRFSRVVSNIGQNRSGVIHRPTMDVHVDHLAEVLVHDNEELSEGTGSYTEGSSINLNQNLWNEDYEGNPDPSVLQRLTNAKHLPKGLDAIAIHRIKRAKIIQQIKELEDDLSSTGSCEFMFDNMCMPRVCGNESEDDDSVNSLLDVLEGASLEASVDLESLQHRKPKVSKYALIPDKQYMHQSSSTPKKPEELVLMLPKRSTSSPDCSQSGNHQNAANVTDESNLLLHSSFLPLQFARNDSNLTDERKTYVEEEMEFTLQKYDLADPQRVAKIIMSGIDPDYKEYDKEEVEASNNAMHVTQETEIEELVQLDGYVFKVRRLPDDDDPVEADRSIRSSSDESSLLTKSGEEGETKDPEEKIEDETVIENQIEPSGRRFFKILSNLHPDYKMQVVPHEEEEDDDDNDPKEAAARGCTDSPNNVCTSPVQCLIGCGGNTGTLMDEPEELFKSFEMPASVVASLSTLSQERANGQTIEKSPSAESSSPGLVPAVSGSEDDEEASEEEHHSEVVMATLTNMSEDEAVANLHEVYSGEEVYHEDDHVLTLQTKASTETQAVMASLDEMIDELNEISDVEESSREIGSMSANLDDLIDELSASSLHLFPEEEEIEQSHTAETEPVSVSPTEMTEDEAVTSSNLNDTFITPASQDEGIETSTTQLTVETEPVSESTTELTEDEAIIAASSNVDVIVTPLAVQDERVETVPVNTNLNENSVNIAVSNLSFASVALPSLESGASSSSQDQGIKTAPAITVSESQDDLRGLCGAISLATLISGSSTGNPNESKDVTVQEVDSLHNEVAAETVSASSSRADKAVVIPTPSQDEVAETAPVNTNLNKKIADIAVSKLSFTSVALPSLESGASSSSQDQGIKTAPAITVSESQEDPRGLCGAISFATLISGSSAGNSSRADKAVAIPTPSQDEVAETAPVNTNLNKKIADIAVSKLSITSAALPSLESGASLSSQEQGIKTAPAITVSESQTDPRGLCGALSLATLISGSSAGNSSRADKAVAIPTPSQDERVQTAPISPISEKDSSHKKQLLADIDVSNPSITSAALPSLESGASLSIQDQGIKTAPSITAPEAQTDPRGLCGAISLATLASSSSSAHSDEAEQSSQNAKANPSHNEVAAVVKFNSFNADKVVTIPTPIQNERVQPAVGIAVSNASFASAALPSIESGASSSSQDQGIMTAPGFTVSESQEEFRGLCGAITLATSNASLSFLSAGTNSCLQDKEAVTLAVKGILGCKGLDTDMPQVMLNAKRLSAPDTPMQVPGSTMSNVVQDQGVQAAPVIAALKSDDLSQVEMSNEDVVDAPSDDDKNVTNFDCERDCEVEFVVPMSPQSEDEDYDARIIKQSSSSFTECCSLNPVNSSHHLEHSHKGAENVAPSMSFNIRSPVISDDQEKQDSTVIENKCVKVVNAANNNSTAPKLDMSEDEEKSVMPNISQMDITGFSGCFNRASSGANSSVEDDLNTLMEALDLTLNVTTTTSFSSSENEEVVFASVVEGVYVPNDTKVGRIILPSEYKQLCEGIEVESSVGSSFDSGKEENKAVQTPKVDLKICTSDDSDVFYDANEVLGASPRAALAKSPKLTIMEDLNVLRKTMSERMSKSSIRRSSKSPKRRSLLDVATTAEARLREVAKAKKILQS